MNSNSSSTNRRLRAEFSGVCTLLKLKQLVHENRGYYHSRRCFTHNPNRDLASASETPGCCRARRMSASTTAFVGRVVTALRFERYEALGQQIGPRGPHSVVGESIGNAQEAGSYVSINGNAGFAIPDADSQSPRSLGYRFCVTKFVIWRYRCRRVLPPPMPWLRLG